jgi:phosphopantothenate synthetase
LVDGGVRMKEKKQYKRTRKEKLIDEIIELEKKMIPTRKELRQLRVEELKEWLRELKEEEKMLGDVYENE